MSTQTVRNDGTGTDSRSFSRYDLLLATLPIPLLFGVGGSTVTGVDPFVGIGFGGLPSLLLLGYALFVASPSAESVTALSAEPVGDVDALDGDYIDATDGGVSGTVADE